jgi:hypothetical protein
VTDASDDNPTPQDDGQRRTPSEVAELKRRRTEVFGDVLPDVTSDERGDDRGDRDGDDDWLRSQVPPHHG